MTEGNEYKHQATLASWVITIYAVSLFLSVVAWLSEEPAIMGFVNVVDSFSALLLALLTIRQAS